MKIDHYFYNWSLEEIKKEGYEPAGKIGLIVSGAPIDNMLFFEKDLEKAIKDANPNLKGISSASVFYKSNKLGLANRLERVTKVAEGYVNKDQHFYIVQPLKKVE